MMIDYDKHSYCAECNIRYLKTLNLIFCKDCGRKLRMSPSHHKVKPLSAKERCKLGRKTKAMLKWCRDNNRPELAELVSKPKSKKKYTKSLEEIAEIMR